jgi:predicted enzyme related to lactoylglutathione lyase
MSNVIGWFEIPVTDMERAEKFFCRVLDLKEMNKMEMGGARMAFFPYADGQSFVSGALVHHETSQPSDKGILIYFNTGEDLTPFLEKVEPAGGKVLIPKTKITDDIGYFAQFLDTEGNRLAFHSRK